MPIICVWDLLNELNYSKFVELTLLIDHALRVAVYMELNLYYKFFF